MESVVFTKRERIDTGMDEICKKVHKKNPQNLIRIKKNAYICSLIKPEPKNDKPEKSRWVKAFLKIFKLKIG